MTIAPYSSALTQQEEIRHYLHHDYARCDACHDLAFSLTSMVQVGVSQPRQPNTVCVSRELSDVLTSPNAFLSEKKVLNHVRLHTHGRRECGVLHAPLTGETM